MSLAAGMHLGLYEIQSAIGARGNTPPLLNWGMLGLAAVIVGWRFWTSRR